ncbi:hypothetical protein GO755_34660 [Spirosoma sp. HMF4905]|uniref:Uncharacterized protein n=1 Tax=Spirosoma arboris TaxID=2682092 RepID=A0A7K1SN74_9BACT|nr:hypothetical protein [Spirosoma arboris]MVM35217.1 hypothetical protein [Spirosoma arboris]
MNAHYKSDKEPIELLLGMGGAVQYLEHSLIDESNYSVWVKTKTGNKQIIIPIEAVRSIQSKKPTPEVIDSIKRQLTPEFSVANATFHDQTGDPQPTFRFWHRLLGLVGIKKSSD